MMISLYYERCTKIFDISSSTSSHIIKAWAKVFSAFRSISYNWESQPCGELHMR